MRLSFVQSSCEASSEKENKQKQNGNNAEPEVRVIGLHDFSLGGRIREVEVKFQKGDQIG